MGSEAEIGLYTEGYLRWDQRLRLVSTTEGYLRWYQRLRLVSTLRATLDGIRGWD